MKQTFYHNPILASLTIVILTGCVPAGQTIAVIDGQRRKASNDIEREHIKTGHLLQTRSQLEVELADLKARRNSLESSDPIGSRSEIAKMNSVIASLERKLANML
jgi:septal ring factor EnvC (AmiA/AmiB activator)